jgi:hypothetical protein
VFVILAVRKKINEVLIVMTLAARNANESRVVPMIGLMESAFGQSLGQAVGFVLVRLTVAVKMFPRVT